LSSSTEDLLLLFEAEKEAVRDLQKRVQNTKSTDDPAKIDVIQKYLSDVDFE
jgi:hypothetical protein